MRKLLIVFLILLFAAIALWGIETAASGTHEVLGNVNHRSFIETIPIIGGTL